MGRERLREAHGPVQRDLMRLSVRHSTTFSYDAPVYLEPHVIRLRPRADGGQRVGRFELAIDPAPVGRADCLDQDGNVVTQVWFSGPVEQLRIESCFEVELLRDNPFDFLLPAERWLVTPFAYGEPWNALLAPYTSTNGISAEVVAFAREMGVASGGRTLAFLNMLSRRLCEDWRQALRPEGEPYSSATTLAAREGSCRDLAVLFCDLCRAIGLASRFVSGYERSAAGLDRPHMHAWAEVYLPGGGWRGFDPSRGLAVARHHVAVAAARFPALAAPLSGTYRGSAIAHLQAQISIELH